jgi:hypothetical protein
MGRLSEISVINLKNKSHSVTAEVVVPDDGGHGVIIAQGDAFAGWCLYLLDGKPKYGHILAGLQRFYVDADSAVSGGEHQVRMEFDYDGGGVAKCGTATLYIDGDSSATAVSRPRSQCSIRLMKPATSAVTRARPSARTTPARTATSTARCAGCNSTPGSTTTTTSSTPEERLRVATAIQ